ncbi:hypothetical protein ACHAXA_010651 [Cyclostephanos tholiformis]|uniref:Uncharacterized protein n=1 Tax=Cyclostephanos tholiformis TaxID=382380 RepID=A0ABD3R590_9STRA
MDFSTWYKAGAIKGRLVFVALCLLVLIAPLPVVERPQFRSRQVVVVVAPPNQLIAKEVLVKKGAVTHRAPAKYHPIFVSPDQSIAIKDLEEKSLGHTIAKRAPAQSHLIFVAPDNSILPEVVVEAPVNPHPIFDAPYHSIPVEVLDEAPDGNVDDNAPAQSRPTPDQSVLTVVLDVNALGGGLMVNAKLAGSFAIDDNARVSKNDPHWGADRTIQVAHVDKVTTKRSLQIVTHPHPEDTTCTLIAAYNTSLPFGAICTRTGHLKSTLEDWEAVSALDVGGECYDPHCRKQQNTRCRPNIIMSPPTSTPALECVVFIAIGLDELTCEKIAANLTTIKGVYNVSVDVEGSTGLGNDMGEGKNDSNSVQLIGANSHVEPAAKEVAGDVMMAGKGANSRCARLLDVDPSDETNVPLEVDETEEDVDSKDDKIWLIEVDTKNEGLFEGNFLMVRKGVDHSCVWLLGNDHKDDKNLSIILEVTKESVFEEGFMAGKRNHCHPCIPLFGVDPKDEKNWSLKVDGMKKGLVKGVYMSGKGAECRCLPLLIVHPNDDENVEETKNDLIQSAFDVEETKNDLIQSAFMVKKGAGCVLVWPLRVDPKNDENLPLKVEGKEKGLFEAGFLLIIDLKDDEYRPHEVDGMKEALSEDSLMAKKGTNCSVVRLLNIDPKNDKNWPIVAEGAKNVLANGDFVSY